ncbi:MAG: Asp-tRNA(Asn)/Glu-tRNA(Gln) amidotransferase GatCAB subunit B [Chloroflexi bacterium]|nr:MAG: Asp-tRNA(Asn)/Glu-tRNA(Gln) amidotransferase subunit GatB [Chloroflexota bacterium]MCQ3938981.1 Asp-tRNA(Asn)/Glu-tRNA(Gln) amidotransferase GatCAB subunit B [Chloroflexota bacterium]MDL1940764.1 Asp-tRNA(Asn)/Glu-tRNA(Gln) amidotransferase subunit GatB [Chloroflexi bacterium CFX2]
MKYEPVIGLEIHAELLTASKMFCGCSADYASAPEPNTNICPVCTGLPGAMPVANKKATELAALVGLALNCSVNKHNTFARKNYYYPDLPKGYQISQYELPICEKGWIEVNAPSPLPPLPKGEGNRLLPSEGEGLGMRVRVRRVHIEEDTAKLFHEKNYALVDFNRAGVPLLEIVSEPDMRTVEAALDYATKVRAILRYLGVNSGDMEKGVLRFEANISVRPVGSDEFRTRTEIKNLNSFRALTRASTYEIERQIKIYESGGMVVQETLGWDDVRGVTTSQRSKEEAHDYRYFPEPDLPPLQLSDAWIESIRTRLPELPEAKTARFISDFGLTPSEARFLTSERALADYFESVVAKSKSPAKTVHSWIAGEFMRYLNDSGVSIEDVTLSPEAFAKLIDMVTDKIVSGNNAKIVLAELIKNGGDPHEIVKAKNLAQVSDEGFIQDAVTKIINDNPSEVEKYLGGKETLLQWFVGQVARATKGKADPNVAKELMVKGLEERKK